MINWKTWLVISIILIALISICFGFIGGYFYGDKECFERPLSYGIKKVNEVNDDYFTCVCSSESGDRNSFSFDEVKIKGQFDPATNEQFDVKGNPIKPINFLNKN